MPITGGGRGMGSGLDSTDIDKNFDLDLPVLFKMREILSVDSQDYY